MRAGSRRHSEVEHLVEVVILGAPVPANRQGVSAHQAVDRRRIEGLHGALHVGLEVAALDQPFEKPRDRHVVEDEQSIEADSVLARERLLPLLFAIAPNCASPLDAVSVTDCGTQAVPARPEPTPDASFLRRGREGNPYPLFEGFV